MSLRLLFLVGPAVLLCISVANAADCAFRSSNLDGFGHYRLGQHLKTLPKGVTRLPDCVEKPRQRYFDCEFTDADGNAYLVGEGSEITRLERRPEISSSAPLPYGLRFGMKVKEAARTIAAVDPAAKMEVGHNEDGVFLSSGECLKDRYGITYAFDLSFDGKGGLSKMTAGFESSEN